MDKKLEARITRLEKLIKNEAADASSVDDAESLFNEITSLWDNQINDYARRVYNLGQNILDNNVDKNPRMERLGRALFTLSEKLNIGATFRNCWSAIKALKRD
jgi:Txe/YoeB family toxin of Txe-Axe toxin-antitoxin module